MFSYCWCFVCCDCLERVRWLVWLEHCESPPLCERTYAPNWRRRQTLKVVASYDFVVPRVNTTGYGKHSVRYLGPVLWSKIDRKFRELKTLYEFKRKIRVADLAKHILPNSCINCTLCYS